MIYIDDSTTAQYCAKSVHHKAWVEALAKAESKTNVVKVLILHNTTFVLTPVIRMRSVGLPSKVIWCGVVRSNSWSHAVQDEEKKMLAQVTEWLATADRLVVSDPDRRYLRSVMFQAYASALCCTCVPTHPRFSDAVCRYWATPAVTTDQKEHWFEINQNGPLIDSCFLRSTALNLKRSEIKATSSALLRANYDRKCDGILVPMSAAAAGHGAQELLYIETSIKGDEPHAGSNVVKLAHLLRDAVSLRLDCGCFEPAYGLIICGTYARCYTLVSIINRTYSLPQVRGSCCIASSCCGRTHSACSCLLTATSRPQRTISWGG